MITFQDKVSLNTKPDIPEINKITDSNINSLKAGINTNETSINNIKSKMGYSETEITTDKVWIDGKPIYRKVIECRTGNSAGTQFTYESTPSNIDTMVRIDGMLNEQSARFPINAWYSNAYYISAYYDPDGTIRGICGSSLVNRTCFIIIEYTKTTDVAS
jgi:hypothetical protein